MKRSSDLSSSNADSKPEWKKTHFHQHIWRKSAFSLKFSEGIHLKWMIASKFLAHVQCKWMNKRSRKWSNKAKMGKLYNLGKTTK